MIAPSACLHHRRPKIQSGRDTRTNFVGRYIVPENIAVNDLIVHKNKFIPPQATHCQSSSPKVKDFVMTLCVAYM